MFDLQYDPVKFANKQSDKLLKKRQNAWEYSQSIGLPNRKNEDWKYTDLKQILTSFDFKYSSSLNTLTKEDIIQLLALDKINLVFIDGIFRKDLSDLNDHSDIKIQSIFYHQELLVKQEQNYSNNVLLNINDAFFSAGVFIEAEENAEIKKDIQLLYINNSKTKQCVSNYRNIIQLKNNSKLAISEKHISLNDGNALVNVVSNIVLSDNATLSMENISTDEQEQVLLTSLIDVRQSKDSNFNYFNLISDGKFNRFDISSDLLGQGAQASINGIFLSKDSMHCDNHIQVKHSASNTCSDVCFKGVATDHSVAVFNAKAIVKHGIHGVKAHQSNKNISLTKTAQIYTKPELEIYSDDVVCSHGATVGQLDKNALFYLNSRGIANEQGVHMLTEAFLKELIYKSIEDKSKQDIVLTRVEDKVGRI